MKTRASILRKALAIIKKRGWCRKHYAYDGRVCSLKAIAIADGKLPGELSRTGSSAADLLARACGNYSIVRWNDSQSTVVKIIAGFRKAIAIAEKRRRK